MIFTLLLFVLTVGVAQVVNRVDGQAFEEYDDQLFEVSLIGSYGLPSWSKASVMYGHLDSQGYSGLARLPVEVWIQIATKTTGKPKVS